MLKGEYFSAENGPSTAVIDTPLQRQCSKVVLVRRCRGMFSICAVALVLALLSGCGGGAETDAAAGFLAAEKERPGVGEDSALVEAGIGRFREFFSDVTAESVRRLGPGLYAEDIWFNDTLKTLRGREAVLAYFEKTAGHLESFRTRVDGTAVSGPDVYVRWTMEIRFKGAKEPVRTVGVTLLRFDRAGRVVLHQDFWDPAAGFYEHLPVLGPVLRWIKSMI
jgi:SnoaL-like domain